MFNYYQLFSIIIVTMPTATTWQTNDFSSITKTHSDFTVLNSNAAFSIVFLYYNESQSSRNIFTIMVLILKQSLKWSKTWIYHFHTDEIVTAISSRMEAKIYQTFFLYSTESWINESILLIQLYIELFIYFNTISNRK